MLKKIKNYFAPVTGSPEKGAMNMVSTLLMGIGMVFLAVGFIVFPIITTATDTLLAYEYSANTSITDATYTGLTQIIGITPLLLLIGYLSASVFAMFLGVKIAKQGAGSSKLDLGGLMLLGISQIFVAVGLIIFPVVLDGVSSVVHGGGTGISSSYTGLSQIIGIAPLLVLISFVAAVVITGYFGLKKLGGSAQMS